MRDSVPSTRYSSVCNVLRQWNIPLIPTYRVYRLYDTYIELYYIYIYIYIYIYRAILYIYIYIYIYRAIIIIYIYIESYIIIESVGMSGMFH